MKMNIFQSANTSPSKQMLSRRQVVVHHPQLRQHSQQVIDIYLIPYRHDNVYCKSKCLLGVCDVLLKCLSLEWVWLRKSVHVKVECKWGQYCIFDLQASPIGDWFLLSFHNSDLITLDDSSNCCITELRCMMSYHMHYTLIYDMLW